MKFGKERYASYEFSYEAYKVSILKCFIIQLPS